MAAFGLGPEDLLIALGRALAVAALCVAFGTLLVRRAVVPRPSPDAARLLGTLQWAALATAALAGMLWCALEANAIGGTHSAAATVAMLPMIFSATEFGHLQIDRFGLLTVAALALAYARGRASTAATVAAGLAVLLETQMLHGAAMQTGPTLLLASEALHVLSAAAWLGALPALAIVVARSAPETAGMAAQRFSAIGIAAVAALAMSAALQAWRLIGSWAGLFATPYGFVVLAKLLLFGLLVALAARNRRRLVPRAIGGAAPARAALQRSILIAVALGSGVLTLASLLATMAPPAEMGGE